MQNDVTKVFLSKILERSDIDDIIKDFDINGLVDSSVVATLDITWPEFKRWQDDNRFPNPNIRTLQWVWRASGRYKKLILADGWTKDVVEAVRPNIQAWRDEHAINRKKKKPVMA
jgi:hypothetical protein